MFSGISLLISIVSVFDVGMTEQVKITNFKRDINTFCRDANTKIESIFGSSVLVSSGIEFIFIPVACTVF